MSEYFNVSPSFFFVNHLDFSTKETIEYTKEIKSLLPTLPSSRIKDVYNIILSFLRQNASYAFATPFINITISINKCKMII